MGATSCVRWLVVASNRAEGSAARMIHPATVRASNFVSRAGSRGTTGARQARLAHSTANKVKPAPQAHASVRKGQSGSKKTGKASSPTSEPTFEAEYNRIALAAGTC